MQELLSCEQVIKVIPNNELKIIIEYIIHKLLEKYGQEVIEHLICKDKKKVMYQEVIFDIVNQAGKDFINTLIMIELLKKNIGKFKLQLDEEECNKLIFYFNNGLSHTNKQYFTSIFHKILEENKYTDSYDFNNIDDLQSLDINIGQTIVSSPTFTVDSNHRDCAFAIIDNKLYKGKRSDHHADLVNKYLKENGYDFEDTYDQQNFSDAIIDQEEDKQGKVLDPNTSVSFGHIWHNIGFVDFTFGNETYKTTSNRLKNELNVDKVFSHDYYSREFTRLAKKIYANHNLDITKQICLNIAEDMFKNGYFKKYIGHDMPTIDTTSELNSEELIDSIFNDNYFQSKFKELANMKAEELNIPFKELYCWIRESLHSQEFYLLYNKYLTELNKNNQQELENELLNNNDKVGDYIDINWSKFDIGYREKPFLIINDKLYIGDTASTHGLLAQKIFNDKSFNYYRPNFDKMSESVAIGHIINSIAFIDDNNLHGDYSEDNLQQLGNLIKSQSNIKKVYTLPSWGSIERLAKKVSR